MSFDTIGNSDISRRAKNCLYKAGFHPDTHPASVSILTEDELRLVPGIGDKTVEEIKDMLDAHDLSLQTDKEAGYFYED